MQWQEILSKKSLLSQAIESYTLGQQLNPNNNFDYQIALLHGQQGNIGFMINSLIDYAYKYPNNLVLVQNQLNRFLNEDHSKVFSEELRKALLIRTQKTQDIFWNEFMSWFFLSVKKNMAKLLFKKKAIFRRNPDDLHKIITLSQLALDEKRI